MSQSADIDTANPVERLTGRPLEFAISPELRRSTLYAAIGATLVLPLVVAILHARGLRPPGDAPLLFLLGIGSVGLYLAAHRWRVRLDERGVWLRRLTTWRFWPWDAFRNGNIREAAESHTFEWPGHGRLGFGLLDSDDRDAATAVVRSVWVPPPAPEPAAMLSLRYGFGREARFSPEGVALIHRDEMRSYDWDDIERLRILRLEYDRRDFVELEVVLPDRKVKLRTTLQHGRRFPSWRASKGAPRPDAEEIAATLLRNIPAEKVVVASILGTPRTQEDRDERLARLDLRARDGKLLRRIFWGVAAAMLLIVAFDDRGRISQVGMLILTGVLLVLLRAVMRYIERDIERARQAALAWSPAEPAE